MPEELDDQTQSYDAQQMVEEIAEGNQKGPSVDSINLDADYEAAKSFSVSEIDDTEAGAQAAEAATSSQFEMPEPTETKTVAEPTGDPSDFIEMAQDVNPRLS